MPARQNLPWYVSILYLVALVPVLFSKYIIEAGAYSPILGAALGVIIFILMCSANWYPPFRKKANYWLTLQENEALAYAWAEPTLYALNGLLVFVSGILIILCILFYEGDRKSPTSTVPQSPLVANPVVANHVAFDCGNQKFINATFYSDGKADILANEGSTTIFHRILSATGTRFSSADGSAVFWSEGDEKLSTYLEENSKIILRCKFLATIE